MPNRELTVDLDCDITIGTDQVIKVPMGLSVNLVGTSQFNLTQNGKIKGEQFKRSRITKTGQGPSISLNDCHECEVENLNLLGENIIPNLTNGISIDSNSTNNKIDAVTMQNLGTGILVAGSCNTFADLQFFNVGSDLDDCFANDNNNAAVHVNNSSQNHFTNIVHTSSPGAISLWLNGECDLNVCLNLTMVQEFSECFEVRGGDPALYVDSGDLCDSNYIATNYNNGLSLIQNSRDTFSVYNTVTGANDGCCTAIRMKDIIFNCN